MLIRVIDLETSGFPGGNPPNMPVEAAYTDITRISPGNFLITKQETTLLNPGRYIEAQAQEVHGITDDDVRSAPSARFASNFFHHNAEVDFIVSHNWKFEANWIETRSAKAICTLICGKQAFPGLRSYKNKTLFDHLGCADVADASLCEPLHRALPDTYVTAHIMLKLLEKYDPEELVCITAGKAFGKKLPLGKFKGVEIDDEKIINTQYLKWLSGEPWVRADLKRMCNEEIDRRAKNGR